MDKTNRSFGFVHACELDYRTFGLHIALFHQVIFRSAPQGSRGILRGKQREKFPFLPFND